MQTFGLRDGGQDQVRVAKSSERDKTDAIGERILHSGRDCQRQMRLAYAAGAGEGEETHVWMREQSVGSQRLLFAANERGERRWECGGRSSRGLRRGSALSLTL